METWHLRCQYVCDVQRDATGEKHWKENSTGNGKGADCPFLAGLKNLRIFANLGVKEV